MHHAESSCAMGSDLMIARLPPILSPSNTYPGDQRIIIGDRTYIVDPSQRKQFILDLIDYALWSIDVYRHFYETGEKKFLPLPEKSWRTRFGVNEPLDIFLNYNGGIVIL